MNNMEELLHVISKKWSNEDLNMVLHLSKGDCKAAITKILQHERMGLPAELLIRSLSNDGAPSSGQWEQQQQQTEGRMLSPSITGRTKNGGSLQLFGDEMAAHSSPYAAATTTTMPPRSFHDVERHDDRLSALSGQASRFFHRNTVPPIIQVEAGSYDQGRHRKDPHSIPQEPGQPSCRRPPSDDTTSMSSLNSYPEALLQRLTPNGKDQFLGRPLSCRRQLGRQGRPEKARVSNNEIDMFTRELEVLNIQTGLLMSFKEEANAVKSRSEDIDGEALKIGIRASKREFRELCRRQDEEEKMEKTLIHTAKVASLDDPSPMSREEFIIEEVKRECPACPDFFSQEDILLEEAKRKSLAYRSSIPMLEERVIVEAKRESLACPPHITNEERLIEEVKRESLATMQAHKESQSLPVENNGIQEVPSTWRLRGNRMPSLAAAAFPFTGDVASIESIEVPRRMPIEEAVDASSSSVSDRKTPAQDQTYVNDASIPRAISSGEFLMPFGGNFGGYNVGCTTLRYSFRNWHEEDSSRSER